MSEFFEGGGDLGAFSAYPADCSGCEAVDIAETVTAQDHRGDGAKGFPVAFELCCCIEGFVRTALRNELLDSGDLAEETAAFFVYPHAC